MKKLATLLLPLILLIGCVSQTPSPKPVATPIITPPMPPGMETVRAKSLAVMSPRAAAAAPAVMAVSAAPMVSAASVAEPSLPYVARTTSITITNQPIFKLTATYEANVYGFGVAYSEDLTNWTPAGEARWTNTVSENPFLYAGTTEHRIWIGEPQWQVTHRPNGTTSNLWKIVLIDHTAGQAKRFYMVYPLEAVSGLPY